MTEQEIRMLARESGEVVMRKIVEFEEDPLSKGPGEMTIVRVSNDWSDVLFKAIKILSVVSAMGVCHFILHKL